MLKSFHIAGFDSSLRNKCTENCIGHRSACSAFNDTCNRHLGIEDGLSKVRVNCHEVVPERLGGTWLIGHVPQLRLNALFAYAVCGQELRAQRRDEIWRDFVVLCELVD